jgi:hypothetical protein
MCVTEFTSQKSILTPPKKVPDQLSEFQNTKDTSSSATAGPDKKADALGKPWETTVKNQDDVHEMDDLMGSFQCNPCSPDSNLKEPPLSTVLVYHMSMNQPSDQFYTGTYPWDDEISSKGDDPPME